MYKTRKMKWLLGVLGIGIVILFSGCAAQPIYSNEPPPLYNYKSASPAVAGPGPVVGCGDICRIRNECRAKASISTLDVYMKWLEDMSQGYYNYVLICADIRPS